METIVISGSMRYAMQMRLAAWLLETDARCAVIQCVYNDFGLDADEDIHKILDECHFRKIDLADSLYVLDINGYIGEHTKAEIEYAKRKGKTIYYHSQDRKQICNTWRRMCSKNPPHPYGWPKEMTPHQYINPNNAVGCNAEDIWTYLLGD